MGTKIQLKRTSVPGKVPLSSDIDVGELAINLADKLIYSKDASGSVFPISSGSANVNITTSVYPIGDYGTLSASSTDAFGVTTNYTFDCMGDGHIQQVDLQPAVVSFN